MQSLNKLKCEVRGADQAVNREAKRHIPFNKSNIRLCVAERTLRRNTGKSLEA